MARKITINNVAQLLHITPEAVRFYEKKKIVNPQRDDENSYRYYTQTDIRKLYDCKIYQSMGFSLQEVIDIFDACSEDKLDEMIAEKEARLKEVVEEDVRALERIKQVKEANEKIAHYKDKFYIMESPHYLAAFHSHNDELDLEGIRHRFWNCVADYYNLFTCAAYIPPENVKHDDIYGNMSMGYTIGFEDAKKLNLYADSHVVELAPKRCVYTTFHAEPVVNAQVLAPTLEWMDKHGFELKDNVLCSTIKITFRGGEESRLYEAWLPIE